MHMLQSALTSFNLCSLQLHFSASSPIMFYAVLQTMGGCSHVGYVTDPDGPTAFVSRFPSTRSITLEQRT